MYSAFMREMHTRISNIKTGVSIASAPVVSEIVRELDLV